LSVSNPVTSLQTMLRMHPCFFHDVQVHWFLSGSPEELDQESLAVLVDGAPASQSVPDVVIQSCQSRLCQLSHGSSAGTGGQPTEHNARVENVLASIAHALERQTLMLLQGAGCCKFVLYDV
jgi:hypothetical protein